jgi:two-component system sensor kinase FixL
MSDSPATVRILVVDDSDSDVLLFQDVLQSISHQSFQVKCAASYDEGMAALSHNSFDIVFLDYMLGENTGLRWLQEARSIGIKTPVVLLSGKGSYAVDVAASRAGAVDYLEKHSLTPVLLERVIRFALERSRYEATLSSERRYRQLMQRASDGIFVTDFAGRFLEVNDSACRLLGYELDELLQLQITDIVAPESLEKQPLNFDMLSTGDAVCIERDFLRKDGARVPVEVSARVQEDGRYMAIVRDISERRRAEAELRAYAARLEQSNRELQDFAYVASHDLQEPLRKIRTFSDCLTREFEGELSPEARDYLQRMQVTAQRMQALIKDLLELSRVTTQGRPFAPIDLNHLMNEVMSDLESRVLITGGQVKVATLPVIEADRIQMRQLFQNLVDNALKFHQPGQNPYVHVYHEAQLSPAESINGGDKMYCFVVEDNGIGFDMQYLERIFSPFQRLHSRTQFEGTGIGLSICRRIVERHGGSITAQSTLGQGSRFIVKLPYRQSVPA